jgi:HEAT repeat protein
MGIKMDLVIAAYAAGAVVLVLLLLSFWSLALAHMQEKRKAKREIRKEYIETAMQTIFSGHDKDADLSNLLDGIKVLKQFIGNSLYMFNVASECFFKNLENVDEDDENTATVVSMVLRILDPVPFYSRQLKNGNKYQRANACRMLASYNATDEMKNIERQLSSRDNELTYNAAMALAELGNESSISQYIINCKENHSYSYRVLMQLIHEYNDDVKLLAELIFRECDDYIKATVIKAIARYRFAEFESIYVNAVNSRNVTLKVAGITALGELANAKYEDMVARTALDRIWIVRNAAVKALGKINTERSLEIVVHLTSDVEWWVRYNAAKTLILMNGGVEKIDQVLDGKDAYAADALKYALYRW